MTTGGPYASHRKQSEDATEVRRRLLAFERAETTDDPEERRALLTFAIGGGAPTGVPPLHHWARRNTYPASH